MQVLELLYLFSFQHLFRECWECAEETPIFPKILFKMIIAANHCLSSFNDYQCHISNLQDHPYY